MACNIFSSVYENLSWNYDLLIKYLYIINFFLPLDGVIVFEAYPFFLLWIVISIHNQFCDFFYCLYNPISKSEENEYTFINNSKENVKKL